MRWQSENVSLGSSHSKLFAWLVVVLMVWAVMMVVVIMVVVVVMMMMVKYHIDGGR